MRAILVLLALAVLVALGLVWMGVIDLNQTRHAQAPGVTGGQAPAFDVKVNPIELGTTNANIEVPMVRVKTDEEPAPEPAPAPAPAGNAQ